MKKALIGIICSALIIPIAYGAEQIRDTGEKRYVQHEEDPAYTQCDCDGKDVLCTNLPIVEIDTDGVRIPGKRIGKNEKTGEKYYTKGPNGESEIEGEIRVIDNGDEMNHVDDKVQTKSRMLIHIRGNSSRFFDKSSYAINLIDKDGDNNNVEVMGMEAHHEWILNGPYIDKTLMRNYMWYNIGGQIMDYAPNVRFCEVIVNGKYRGLYVMMESITAGKNGARLNISVDKKDQTYSGYLLRVDRGSETSIKNIVPFSDYTYRNTSRMNIVYPGTSNLTEDIRFDIQTDFSKFEKTLYSYDYNDPDHGYKELIDVESFADYFILNEFTQNYDAGWLSTYIYKDSDGLFRMCMWDFNSACNGYRIDIPREGFIFQDAVWFNMLIKDEDFVEEIIDRYRELRKGVLSEEYLYSYIDSVQAYLGDAVQRNYKVWGYTFGEDYDVFYPKNRNPRNYQQAVDYYKKMIHERGEWMDSNIESLRQYSAESKVKKFNHQAN